MTRAVYPFRINFPITRKNNKQGNLNAARKKIHRKKSTLVILSDVLSGDKMVETIQIRNAGDAIQ